MLKLSRSYLWTFESLITGLGLVIGVSLVIAGALGWGFYHQRLYPGTEIGSVAVGSLSKDQALAKLKQANLEPEAFTVTLYVDDIEVASSSAVLGAHYDFEATLNNRLTAQKSQPFHQKFVQIMQGYVQQRSFSPILTFDQKKTEEMVSELAQDVLITGAQPKATLEYSNQPGSLIISPGEPGRELVTAATVEHVLNTASPDKPTLMATIASTSARLSETEIESTREYASRFVGKRLRYQHDITTKTLNDQDLIDFIQPPSGIDRSAVESHLKQWAETTDRQPTDAQFEYDPETLAVTTFIPHRTGRQLQVTAMADQVITDLERVQAEDESEINGTLVVTEVDPEITLEKTNDLGIKERIGFGESEYDHSIPNRIHNVSITADRISLTIVPPGKEFSFNQTLGEVSAATGYRSAYVIKNGRTELGDGGGVCQVSSTLFRALLDSGLKITRRLQHSYRVSYYELNSDPGFDATVYAGNVDLRFVNDTDHHILVYAKAFPDTKYMYVELFGTSDGRQSKIVDYRKWDSRPPLPPEYYDDPSLPPGAIKQIDWAASGIKAEFTRIVTDANGEPLYEDTYYSNYRPWAAKFLRGV